MAKDKTTVPTPLAREPGMYWVKWSAAGWWPAIWSNNSWYRVQTEGGAGRNPPHEISPRIPSPDERTPGPSSAPLAERLREAIETAERIIALYETPRKRPTIEDLEKLLQQSDSPPVTINPDGSISAGVSDALVVARALLAALDGREAWNEAIEAAAKWHDKKANDTLNERELAHLHTETWSAWEQARHLHVCSAIAIRALARPQPAGEAT